MVGFPGSAGLFFVRDGAFCFIGTLYFIGSFRFIGTLCFIGSFRFIGSFCSPYCCDAEKEGERSACVLLWWPSDAGVVLALWDSGPVAGVWMLFW